MKIKTIDINALEWRDKINGNSYFAATIVLNYGMKDAKNITLPFQYGYGDHYVEKARQELKHLGLIQCDDRTALWRYCEENKIILRYSKQTNCKKSELKNL